MRLVRQLLDGPHPVNDLCDALDLQPYNASRHLAVLKSAGLVEVEKVSKQRIYRLAETFSDSVLFFEPGSLGLDAEELAATRALQRAFADLVGRMAETLRARGPDDAGTWTDAEAGIALGFRRLAILDENDRLLRSRLRTLSESLPEMIGDRACAALLVGSVAEGRARDDSDMDVLLVLRPKDWTDKQELALDQYLMYGGKAIVCLVGDGLRDLPGVLPRIFGPLAAASIPIRMISVGASKINVSLLVDQADALEFQRVELAQTPSGYQSGNDRRKTSSEGEERERDGFR